MDTLALSYNNIFSQVAENEIIHQDKFSVNVKDKNTRHTKTDSDITNSFFDYLDLLHLEMDQNLVVLPSKSHFYYETEDLKEVKTLVNLRQLNDITQIRDFVQTLAIVLPHESYFIGCFFDNKKQTAFKYDSHKHSRYAAGEFDPAENGIASRIPWINIFYNLIDFRTTRYMTKKSVSLILKDAALLVRDMTEIKELTFFCAQKVMSA